jgi:hypothetical protein
MFPGIRGEAGEIFERSIEDDLAHGEDAVLEGVVAGRFLSGVVPTAYRSFGGLANLRTGTI